jgi:hypothetical protein
MGLGFKIQILCFLLSVIDLSWFEFEFRKFSVILLVLCCIGDRCGMTGSDGNHGRSRRPGVKDRK